MTTPLRPNPLRWAVLRGRSVFAVVGVWLALALLLAAGGVWLFVELADAVAEGATDAFDHALMRWLDVRANPALDFWASSVTHLGAWLVVGVMGLLVSAFLWIHGERRALVLLWVALLGTALLNDGLKAFFARERPDVFAWRTDRAIGYSFPSGHAMNAAVAYTIFAYLLTRLGPSRPLAIAIVGVAAVIVAHVAWSRVHLGVHYPSDVLAGVLVGFGWAMACVFAVYVLRAVRGTRDNR